LNQGISAKEALFFENWFSERECNTDQIFNIVYVVKIAVSEEKGLVTHFYTKIVTLSHAFTLIVVVRAL
jgi:hypothetical protein